MRNNPNQSTQTNITPCHRNTFNALTSGKYTNFALFSCFVDGEPAAAIVAINADGEVYNVQPLFVSVTEKMILTDHEGKTPGSPHGFDDIATSAQSSADVTQI